MRFFCAILSMIIVPYASAFLVKNPQPKLSCTSTQINLSSPNPYVSTLQPATLTTATSAGLDGMGVRSPAQEQQKASLDFRGNSLQKPEPKQPVTEKIPTVWECEESLTVQGGSLRTWSFLGKPFDRVQVLMGTEGRPLNANIELWQGPDNTPVKMDVYVEDGSSHPFSTTIETPRDGNTVAIRNTGNLEFPLTAAIEPEKGPSAINRFSAGKQIIQGGALKTYPFDPSVQSVKVMLTTNGRPLNARIELLQGPNNEKQIMELYTEDGMERPFYFVLATPGSGNVIRIVNTATVEFPLSATIEAHTVEDY